MRTRLVTQPVVAITVGSENPKTFYLHRSLVCHESTQLSAALDTTDTCTLAGEDPELFGLFVDYLYREAWSIGCSDCFKPGDYLLIARVYGLADRLGADDFKHTLQYLLHEHFEQNVNVRSLMPVGHVEDLLEYLGRTAPRHLREDRFHKSMLALVGRNVISQAAPTKIDWLGQNPEIAAQLLAAYMEGFPWDFDLPVTRPPKRFRPDSGLCHYDHELIDRVWERGEALPNDWDKDYSWKALPGHFNCGCADADADVDDEDEKQPPSQPASDHKD